MATNGCERDWSSVQFNEYDQSRSQYQMVRGRFLRLQKIDLSANFRMGVWYVSLQWCGCQEGIPVLRYVFIRVAMNTTNFLHGSHVHESHTIVSLPSFVFCRPECVVWMGSTGCGWSQRSSPINDVAILRKFAPGADDGYPHHRRGIRLYNVGGRNNGSQYHCIYIGSAQSRSSHCLCAIVSTIQIYVCTYICLNTNTQ